MIQKHFSILGKDLKKCLDDGNGRHSGLKKLEKIRWNKIFQVEGRIFGNEYVVSVKFIEEPFRWL